MKEKKAFTLAETMIVLVVLGVIATLTVPALIQKQRETANRTKVKKAMSVYETALNKMVIENGIKDNAALYESANSFAPENNCTNTAPYFKVSTVLNNNICKFKAPDGLFWDISKINAPVIAFKEADLNDINAKNRFQLVGHFDNNGILRVDDLAYETGNNKTALTKVYNYINNVKEKGSDICTTLACLKEKIGNVECEGMEFSSGYSLSGGVKTAGSACYVKSSDGNYAEYYDENGRIAYLTTSWGDVVELNDAGQNTMYKWGCDGNGENCTGSSINEYNDAGQNTMHKDNCDGNGENCTSSYVYEYNDAGQQTMWKYNCDGNGENCTSSQVYEYNDAGQQTMYKSDCDGNGIRCRYCYNIISGSCKKNSQGYYDPEDTVSPQSGNSSGSGPGSGSGSGYYSGSGSGYYSGSGSGY